MFDSLFLVAKAAIWPRARFAKKLITRYSFPRFSLKIGVMTDVSRFLGVIALKYSLDA